MLARRRDWPRPHDAGSRTRPAPAPSMRVPPRPHALHAALLLVAALAACASEPATAPFDAPRASASAASPTAPPAASAGERAVARARTRLERAAAGLTYMSESDYPFEFVAVPAASGTHPSGARPRGALDEAALRAAFAIHPGRAVASVSLDDFFARHIDRVDPADAAARALVPRYRALKRTVHAVTGATRVLRVGDVEIRCYLVGVDTWGNVVGLATTSIET